MADHLAYTVHGAGPGLLLAHGGGGGAAANFGALLDDLATTHTVVGPDYPGSGDTPRSPVPLRLDGLADGIAAAATDAGLDRFAVLGYSLGAAVAVRAATRHPERVTGLVLTAGFARPNNRVRLAVDVWRALLDQPDRTLLAGYLTLMGIGEPHLNAMAPDEVSASVAALGGLLPAGTPEQVDLVARVDVRADLPRIAVPTLVVATAFDGLAGPVLSRELAAAVPGAELVEIAAGHSPGVEARDEWLAAVRSLLGRLS